MGRLLPGYLIVLAVGLVGNSILGAAMIRSVLRPDDSEFGFMRFGADEMRQLGLALLTFVVFFGVYIGAAFAAFVVGGIIGLAGKAVGVLAIFVLIAAIFGGMLFLAVRLSLAPALTFDSGRVNLFGSWALTRGRFWPLFGVYLLAIVLVIVVYLLFAVVIFALGAVLGGGDVFAAITRPDMSSPAAYFTPWRIAQMVLSAGVSALVWPVIFTPPAAIYRQLAGTGVGAAEAFS